MIDRPGEDAAPRERRASRFLKGYDAGRLATVEECNRDLDELLTEIAGIEKQLARFYGLPSEALDAGQRAWLARAKAALAWKHRLRHAINARRGQMLYDARRTAGETYLQRQERLQEEWLQKRREHEAEVRARKEQERAEKDRRVAANVAETLRHHRLFVKLVRQRYGDEVVNALWAEVNGSAEQEDAA